MSQAFPVSLLLAVSFQYLSWLFWKYMCHGKLICSWCQALIPDSEKSLVPPIRASSKALTKVLSELVMIFYKPKASMSYWECAVSQAVALDLYVFCILCHWGKKTDFIIFFSIVEEDSPWKRLRESNFTSRKENGSKTTSLKRTSKVLEVFPYSYLGLFTPSLLDHWIS